MGAAYYMNDYRVDMWKIGEVDMDDPTYTEYITAKTRMAAIGNICGRAEYKYNSSIYRIEAVRI